MNAIWSLGQAMFTKVVVVVDHDVNVQNSREVVWKALCAIDPERDIQFVLGSGGLRSITPRAGRTTDRRWELMPRASGRRKDTPAAGPTKLKWTTPRKSASTPLEQLKLVSNKK